MKRLVHSEISKIISFEENKVSSIVIENPNFFRQAVTALYEQTVGNDGPFVLSDDYEPIDLSKNVELLTQFIPFEINKKSLLNKIISTLEKEAVNEENFCKTQELLSMIERYLNELLLSYSYDFIYEKLTVSNLMKSIGLSLVEDYDNGLEKILDYMQLVREFDRDKIFVFVNLRSYYSAEDMMLFFKEVIARKFQILLLDNVDSDALPYESRLIIDKDLCEIY